jgi:hypothetical protein
MLSSGMLRRVTLVTTDTTKENISTIIKVKIFGDLGTTLAVPSK